VKSLRESRLTATILAAIALTGVALRVGYAIRQPAAPPPDAVAYERIAESLYRDAEFDARPAGVDREAQPSSAYSPGLPLFVAAVYLVSGGVHPTLALVLLALIGAAAVPLAYLLGLRFAGVRAGLFAAAVVAIYPALLEYQGLLLTEPLAATLLCAGLVAFFAAADTRSRRGFPWRWLGTGAILGLLALVRPEYLPVALGLPIVWLARESLSRADGSKGGAGQASSARRRKMDRLAPAVTCLLATVLVLAPWTIRNAVDLHRFVPISTGGGKALYIGTNLEADGDPVQLRELLLSERPRLRARLAAAGPIDDPHRLVLEGLLERVAAESYPDLDTDEALGHLGRRNLGDELTGEPLRLAGMFASKSYATWTDAARGVMLDQPWRALQLAVVVLALAGLAILLWRRRFEGLVSGLVLLYMTAIAALLIASPRRELVVLPLLTALAGAALAIGRDSLAQRWTG
jgi:4-amino-4-deoxy-L-arabinose transferase-like glycosyltransferase